ncbi:MAG: SpoIIAA family protein [Planctomycetota bacterium]
MPHEFSVDEKKARLSVRIAGPGSLDDARTTIPRMLELCGKHGLTSILLDLRGVGWHPDDLTLHQMGGMYEGFAGKGTRIAVVGGKVPEAEEFFGVVARDRGADMRVFATVAEAEAWLDEASHQAGP